MIGALLPLARVLLATLEPLRDALDDPSGRRFQALLHDLGWDFEVGDWFADLPLVSQIGPLITEALELLDDLDNSSQSGAELTLLVIQALDLANDFRTNLQALNTSLPTGAAVPPEWKQAAFWAALAADLPEYLILRWLAYHKPVLHALLRLAGVIEEVQVGGGDRSTTEIEELRLAYLLELMQDPAGALAARFDWTRSAGGSNFNAQSAADLFDDLGLVAVAATLHLRDAEVRQALVGSGELFASGNALLEVVRELDIPALHGFLPQDSVAVFTEQGLLLVPVPEHPGDEQVAGLFIGNLSYGTAVSEFDLSETWKLRVSGSTDASAALGVVLIPGQAPAVRINAGIDPIFELSVSNTPGSGPWIPFGTPQGTRLEIAGVEFSIALNGSASEPDLEILARSASNGSGSGLTFAIEPAQGDSFVAGLLGGTPIDIGMDLVALWSAQRGLVIEGGGGFEIEVPLDWSIGPLTLMRLLIGLALGSDGAEVRLGLTAMAALGPFLLVVDNVGFRIELLPAEDEDGVVRIGGMALAVSFKPPDGVGVEVDAAGLISGGGYLYIDPDADGEYAGVLSIDLFGIGISAIALIDTHIPGGGWSFFLALFFELPSIQLGFGFTLNGVGGIAGINRTLDPDGLRAVIRSGSLDSVLFPENPIADAPIIIEAVQAIFPSALGRFVFGPVIQIGWGTPTLIEAEIGIVISLPDPIVIAVLGSVTSILPTPDADLVALHLDVAGIIDTGAGTLSIDSSLHGSHIVGFPLSGDMALRSAFGDAPSFLMALGGNHPGFERPDRFPEIERLALAINAGSVIDVRFDCYFAISSNSIQFGSAFELSAEIEGFGINGGASFDAIVNFSPFSFITQLGYHISVRAAGVDLLAVWLDARLSGPNPWHINGSATFTILGIDNTIRVDERIGSQSHDDLPEIVDVLEQVRAALALPQAWSVESPGGSGVIFAAEDPGGDELVVTPDSSLGVSQRVVPLNITIDKSDPWRIEGGYNHFDLQALEAGMPASGTLSDWFTVSSYMDLSPNEQLSKPSFEKLKSGIVFGGGDPAAGEARRGTLDFEQILRDPELEEDSVGLPGFNLAADPRAAELGQIASGQGTNRFAISSAEAPIQVESPGYAVRDRLTGEVLANTKHWTAGRSSDLGRKASSTVVPAWEVSE